jgi:DMSO/TMAO reductase YedYZ molybdopterin-dependent catalytic subunit
MTEQGRAATITGAAAQREIDRRTRRSFLVGAGAGLAGLAGFGWLWASGEEGGLSWPLRRVLEFNEWLSRSALGTGRLAPEFPRDQAQEPRVNGTLGLGGRFDPATWKLQAVGPAGRQVRLTLADVQALPRVEMVTQLKCVEGWSVVVRWAGARLSDLAAQHGLATHSGRAPAGPDGGADLLRYVALQTPDRGYYVGLDMASALHSQTLLCYEMNGQPLTPEHGAPLRLVTALKYGYKSIKRIGRIRFTDDRPPDLWAERGYDWYAGH